MLERASVIDHDNTRAGTAQRRAELLQGYRFARPGLAEDCDIMVARRIFERTPEKWLAAPADQHEMGHLPTQKLALDGCEVHFRGRQKRAHTLPASETAREAIRHRHELRTQKAPALQVVVVDPTPARSSYTTFHKTLLCAPFSF